MQPLELRFAEIGSTQESEGDGRPAEAGKPLSKSLNKSSLTTTAPSASWKYSDLAKAPSCKVHSLLIQGDTRRALTSISAGCCVAPGNLRERRIKHENFGRVGIDGGDPVEHQQLGLTRDGTAQGVEPKSQFNSGYVAIDRRAIIGQLGLEVPYQRCNPPQLALGKGVFDGVPQPIGPHLLDS
ncbi:hypothetical protein PspLS_06411 [Pyricularia sp. CBS 133598]|nr:hypothetical protein PspLS_06411 [Pyricularia sp. CBS 133598]